MAVVDWILANWVVVSWFLATGLGWVLHQMDNSPRFAGLGKLLVGLFGDVPKMVEGLHQLLTGIDNSKLSAKNTGAPEQKP